MEGEVYSTSALPEAAAEIESSTCQEVIPNPRKKKNKDRMRFSDEQISSLESIFETETRLEPRKKLQLARDLGLQPRQVAIWFQNRRARWKSKKIEQSYRVLRANYDNLRSQFESLKKDRQSLLTQLQKLTTQLEKGHDGGSRSKDTGGKSTSCASDGGDTHGSLKTTPSCLNKGSDRAVTDSDDEEGGKAEYFQQVEAEHLNMGGQVDCSLALAERWCKLDSSALFDQSCDSSNWWDFWT